MVGLAVLGMLLLPMVVGGTSLHSRTASSAVLVPGLPPEHESASSCVQLNGADCPAKNAAAPAALALSVSTPVPTAAPTDSPVVTADPTPTPEPLPTMEVRAGDTLVALAEWFGVTPFDIAAVNGVSVDDYLQIGEVLAIPVDPASFGLPPDPNAYVAEAPADTPADDPALEPAAAPTLPPTPEPTLAPYIPPSGDEIVAAICSLPWPCEQMVRIASCESGLNPRAHNPAGYFGLFQISNEIDNWDDPITNATFAYQYKYLPALASGDPLTPWPVCRSY